MIYGDIKSRSDLKICKHKLYGCTGAFNTNTAHTSEASKYCTFSGKSKDEIRRIRDVYFTQYPDAKAEYKKMYPEETEKDMRGAGNEGRAVSNGWFYSSFARQTGFVDVGNSNLRGRSIRQRDGICRLEQTKRVYAVL